jgi:hypothetical protein
MCSYCGAGIDEESVPLRLWNPANYTAVFCEACMVTHWGFAPRGDDGDDEEVTA